MRQITHVRSGLQNSSHTSFKFLFACLSRYFNRDETAYPPGNIHPLIVKPSHQYHKTLLTDKAAFMKRNFTKTIKKNNRVLPVAASLNLDMIFLRKICLMFLSSVIFVSAGLSQTTVTLNCTGATGSFNSGYVTSGGAKTDGNLIVDGNTSSTLRRGWATFDLSSIPSGSTVNSVSIKFTVTSNNAVSTVTNGIFGFTGSPSSTAGATLYTNAGSGTSFNSSTWTQNVVNTLAFNSSGITFIKNNLGTSCNIGLVRGNGTAIFNIAGYPTTASQPQLVINYTLPAYRAQFVSMNTGSATWCAGETRSVSVVIKNIGTSAWTDGGGNDFNVGVKWNTNGTSWADYYVRVDAQNLAPGATGTFTLPLTASNATAGPVYGASLSAGSNNITFDVVYEGVSWFGGNGGVVGPGNTAFASTSQTITAPTATAGAALAAICQGGTSAALGGTVGGTATGGTWSDGGVGGTFNPNAATLNATWAPPPAYSGTATLTLTSSGGTCGSATAQKNQAVSATAPAAAAGPDQSACLAPFTLAANTASPGTGAWSILAGSPNTSAAQFNSVSNPAATFTPTVSGTYTLRWTISNSPCANTTDDVIISVLALPTANAGAVLSAICQGSTSAALGGSVGGSATGGTWTDGGVGGTFNSGATNLNTTWTPPTGYAGTAILTLTTNGGSCGTTTASKNQVVTATAPTASAGADQTICILATQLAANAAGPGTGAWSILAGGPNTSTAQFSSTGNPAATFTPTTSGSYTLRWTISNAPCTASFDDVVFSVNPSPQISAVTGNTICSGGIGQLTLTTSAGTGPFTVIYNPGAVSEGGVASGSPFNLTPNPGSTTAYTITSITDNNGCVRTSGFTASSASVTVNGTGTWVGGTTDWFTPSNWCGGAIPTAATNVVIPSGGTQPTIGAAGAVCNNLTINSGATLTLGASGGISVAGTFTKTGTLTANATSTFDYGQTSGTQVLVANNYGNLVLSGGGTKTFPSGTMGVAGTFTPNTFTTATAGTIDFNGSVAQTIPAFNYNNLTSSSTGTRTLSSSGTIGVANTFTAGSNTYTSTGSTVNYNGSASVNIAVPAGGYNNLTISGSGTYTFAANNTIAGNYLQTAGAVIFNTTGTTRTIALTGDFTQNGGSIDFTSGSATTNINISGDLSVTGAATMNSSGSAVNGTFVYNGTGIQTLSFATPSNIDYVNHTVNSGATLQLLSGVQLNRQNTANFRGTILVNSGGTIDCANQNVTSQSTGSNAVFTISSGAKMITANATGVQGSVTTTNLTATYNSGATYEFQGAATGIFTTTTANTVNNLIINRSAGVTLSQNLTATNSLDFQSGILTTSSFTVTVGSAGSVLNANASKYVSGKLARVITTTAATTFPIGKGGNYRPATFTYAASPGTKTVTLEQFESAFPVTLPASVSAASFGSRYWNITQSATGTAFTIALNNSGITPTGTARIVRSEGGGASSSNAASFSSPNYSNSSTFATGNVSNNVALGETAIPLTITGVSVTSTKVYNGTTAAALNTGSAALSGIISPDVVTLNSGSAAGAYADKHVGTGKAITVTGFTLGGANAGAYSLPTPNQVTGLTADITIRPITVTAVTSTKTYDGNNSSAGVPTYTLQSGDGTSTAPTQTFDTKHAGTGKVLTATGLVINDGNGGNNYSISYATNNTGVINVRNITVTAVTDTKFYDGNTSSAAAPTYTLQPGDGTTTAPTQTFNNATVGTGKTLTASGLVINDGNGGNNYNIGYAVNNTGIINQLAVTVTPDAEQFKIFGSSDPAFTYTASPSLISPDVFTGALNRVSGETIGTYAYTLGTLSANGNYTVSLGGSNTFEIQAVGQSNADFRSKANGNFSTAATWEYDLGGGNWQNASQAPTSANSVSITHDVTLNQDFTVGASKNFELGTGAVFTINPTRTFTIAGSADFTGKSVTVKSDITGTGSIGEITGTLSNATNVTIERYIPNNGFRSWRLLSVPTSGNAQTIRQAWQEGNANPLPLQNNLPGFGTQITGVGNSVLAQAAGLDSVAATASMLRWNGAAWAAITNTNNPIANFPAYFLFIRGERSKGVTTTNNNSSATILRTNGTVYSGDQLNTIGTNAFALVPNLYPSAIDFTGLPRTGGVSNLFYVWDSKKLSGNSLGIYQTFSATNGFNCLVSGGSYTLAQPNTTIESGQAFFVQSTTAGSLTLKESAKISGTNGSLGFRPGTPTPTSGLVKIDSRLFDASNTMVDANVVVFDAAYSNLVDGDDAPKLTNPGENMAIKRDNATLVIEGRQPVGNNDVVPFWMWNLRQQTYRFEFVAANMTTPGLTATLEDSYLNTSTLLNLTGTTSVNFTVDANAVSSSANRFRIVFKQAVALPVTFISINGNRTTAGIKVDWKVTAERSIRTYDVQRSVDGSNFNTVGTVTANGNSSTDLSYSLTDAAAPSTAVFYRIKSNGIAGDIKYSTIVKIGAGNIKPAYVIAPNPVENGIMNLQFRNQPAGKYIVKIMSNEGQVLITRIIDHTGGYSNQLLNLPETMARGTYQVEITAADGTRTMQALLVNSK